MKNENSFLRDLPRSHIDKTIFGKVKINRHLCPNCGFPILGNDKRIECDMCGLELRRHKYDGIIVVVPPSGIRKMPPKKLQEELLKSQNYRCYWCGNKFDTFLLRNNQLEQLKVHFDHKVPFSYEKVNRDDNWVASCNICNLLKSSFMFKKEEDCRKYLLRRWHKAIDNGKICPL